jgi:hypothetical protein
VALLNDGAVAFAPLDVVQDLFVRRGLDEIALQVQTEINENVDRLERPGNAWRIKLARVGG